MTETIRMSPEEIEQLIACYRDGLLNDTLPFWIPRCVDTTYGGFCFGLGRDGTPLNRLKFLQQHGRFAWLLSTLYRTVEPRQEWIDLARHGLAFVDRHGFDHDGRLFQFADQRGRPLRKPPGTFPDCYVIAAKAAYAQATGDEQVAREARHLFEHVADCVWNPGDHPAAGTPLARKLRLARHYLTTPGLLRPSGHPARHTLRRLARYLSAPHKFTDRSAPARMQARSMIVEVILMWAAQCLREVNDGTACDELIDRVLYNLRHVYMNHELMALPSFAAEDGSIMDHAATRSLVPGHGMEAAWFILTEAQRRGRDAKLMGLGLTILDWSWAWGWDEKHGGVFVSRDLDPAQEDARHRDIKLSWPQNETIVACLLAYRLTGRRLYLERFRMAHEWAHRHYPDPEYGEWFGYLRRDGSVAYPVKGSIAKGPFHMPRMQLLCWQMLEDIKKEHCADTTSNHDGARARPT